MGTRFPKISAIAIDPGAAPPTLTLNFKYPDGTPAIVQASVGDGWVILSGVHPEAPESWRRGMNFTTPASLDNAYAAKLIEAALRRTQLEHF